MDSQSILYSKGHNDECSTPAYAVLPLLKYLDKSKIIWCPFDTADSQYVKVFQDHGFKVVRSHISEGQDFYNYQPEEWDILISNSPFTNKRLIFERALSFNRPFALLMTNTWLNDKYSKFVFYEARRQMQLLMFDKRILFTNNGVVNNKITFSCSYYCCDFLPKDIIVEPLETVFDGQP